MSSEKEHTNEVVSLDEMKKQLAELQRQRQAVEGEVKSLKKSRVHKGKIRADCNGPCRGEKCPTGAFRFFESKTSNWRCDDCIRLQIKRETAPIRIPGPPDGRIYEFKRPMVVGSPEHTLYEKVLDWHTLRTEVLPSGRTIRIGFKGTPLLKSDQEDWLKLTATKDNVPEGHFWCIKNHAAWAKFRKSCLTCTMRSQCEPFLLYEARKKVSTLQEQMAKLTISDKIKEKQAKEQAARMKQLEELEEKKRKKEVMQKYGQTIARKLCGLCKKELEQEKQYWVFDGTRWVRQVTGKIEMDKPQKRRCDACGRKD